VQEVLYSIEKTHFNRENNADPNLNYNVLYEIIQQAKTKHIPVRMVKFSRYKHKMSPWITKGILRSIQYKNNLYKTQKMTSKYS
jgi:hypothetical protein